MSQQEPFPQGSPEEQQGALYAALKVAFYQGGNRGSALRTTSDEDQMLQQAYAGSEGRDFVRLEQSAKIAYALQIVTDAILGRNFFAREAPLATSGFILTPEMQAALAQTAAQDQHTDEATLTVETVGGENAPESGAAIAPKPEKEEKPKSGRASKEKEKAD